MEVESDLDELSIVEQLDYTSEELISGEVSPFEVLLNMLAAKRLDLTTVALSEVTDDFITLVMSTNDWDIDKASQFLVVAATLLEWKVARLLPNHETEVDEETAQVLEKRDLLFARLLQYRAYKEVAAGFALRFSLEERRFGREVPIEPQFADLLPELLWFTTPTDLAQLAAEVFLRAKGNRHVSIMHLHDPLVPIAPQMQLLAQRLSKIKRATFADLISDAPSRAHIISRFLAILELFRHNQVVFAQVEPLSTLEITWVGNQNLNIPIYIRDAVEER